MADPERPLFADAKAEITQLGADLREMAALRWQLARLELDAAVASIKRLAVLSAVAAVLGLTALALLAVCAADLLAQVTGLSRAVWLGTFALLLLLGAGLAAWRAWKRFPRRFVGLEETLEELREDLVWLEEWTGQGERDQR